MVGRSFGMALSLALLLSVAGIADGADAADTKLTLAQQTKFLDSGNGCS